MMTLQGRYAGDPVLLRFYNENLPKAGWAGATDNVERRFVAATRKAQGKKPRGKPFQSKPPSSQCPARLVRDVDEVNDWDVAVAAAR